MLLSKGQLPDNFICINGILYVPKYYGFDSCKFCDLKSEVSQLDCSCICALLGNGNDYCLKAVYTDLRLLCLR